mmetsp:Transcript_18094/g.45364  ORF Transcript_18094/g.45364 Transcript_18094/m.45364 type:complete len:259 (+) Transcript_18094:7091-7867(+)
MCCILAVAFCTPVGCAAALVCATEIADHSGGRHAECPRHIDQWEWPAPAGGAGKGLRRSGRGILHLSQELAGQSRTNAHLSSFGGCGHAERLGEAVGKRVNCGRRLARAQNGAGCRRCSRSRRWCLVPLATAQQQTRTPAGLAQVRNYVGCIEASTHTHSIRRGCFRDDRRAAKQAGVVCDKCTKHRRRAEERQRQRQAARTLHRADEAQHGCDAKPRPEQCGPVSKLVSGTVPFIVPRTCLFSFGTRARHSITRSKE